MSKRYSPTQKHEALALLEETGVNLENLSDKLKIPVRTLYTWRKEARQQAQLQQFQTKNTLAAEQNLQQLQQNPPLPPLQQSAFGMSRDDLIRALEIEYIPSPYEDMRQALMMHIAFLLPSVGEDPDTAHVRTLAISRMLDDVIRLEPLCRLEKPQINIIKYEYKDGTYHDFPEWSNAVYARADQAFNAVLLQARREYYALKGEVYDESRPVMPIGQEFDEIEQPTLEELAQMHFTAEDFTPKHTGIFAYMLNRDEYNAQNPEPNPADYGFNDYESPSWR